MYRKDTEPLYISLFYVLTSNSSFRYLCHPLPFLQYSNIPHLHNSVFNKHWEYFKFLKSPILTRFFKYTLYNSLAKGYSIDPFFYIFMFHKYHLCFTFTKTCPKLGKFGKQGRSLMLTLQSSYKV